jgi:isocitrate/isopropylmalate dehydrogenase
VTICEKTNVLRETSGMMEDEARAVARGYPGITPRSTNIDAETMWLTKNPENYGVVVASNRFGGVISDAFAELIGGLGFAASGNIGDEEAVFEPTHGSAPTYAELDPPFVNPIATFVSPVMMPDHVGEVEKARRIRDAIRRGGEARQNPHRWQDAHSGQRTVHRAGRGQHGANDGRSFGETGGADAIGGAFARARGTCRGRPPIETGIA